MFTWNLPVDQAKRVHVIACGVLSIDLEAITRRLGIEASLQFLPGGLHETPHELRKELQQAIDDASAAQLADRIAVGYGVCGRGAVGIHARHIPLVIPRVEDCIALFLGSDAAYREQFARYPGTYYISAGWVEEKVQPQSMDQASDDAAPVDGDPSCFETDDLIAKYGQENADAIRHFLSSWQRNYQRAAFIDTGITDRRDRYADLAKAMAREFGWEYEEIPGTSDLLEQMLAAERSNDQVLVVPPHHVTAHDPMTQGLKAVPFWQQDRRPQDGEKPLPSVIRP